MWAGASSVVAALTLLACNEPLAPPGAKDKPKPVAPVAASDAAVTEMADGAIMMVDAGRAVAMTDAAVEAPSVTLYTVVDALADAKSSPLKRIGIGAWPGNFSIKGCIYRNDRVFVVDVYCTYKEQTAFSVVVISPDKGEVRLYAEANDPISTIDRSDYFSFYAESYPVLSTMPAPTLKDATFDDVTTWQQKLYDSRILLPAMSACSTQMRTCDQDEDWQDAATEFVAEPTDDWKWVVDQLRNRAQHSGKYVEKKAPK